MSNFDCTYDELRTMAGEFVKEAKKPNITLEALDAGHKCVTLHYIGMKAAHSYEVAGAAALMRVLTPLFLKTEAKLLDKQPD